MGRCPWRHPFAHGGDCNRRAGRGTTFPRSTRHAMVRPSGERVMRVGSVRAGAFVLLAVAGPAASHAAGIDCSKARSPTEKAICADPRLLALDGQVASAYADLLARQPDRKDALRADLLHWLKQRDAACALPSADIPRCVGDQLTARLAALAPPSQPASFQPAAVPIASATPAPVAGRCKPPPGDPSGRPADPARRPPARRSDAGRRQPPRRRARRDPAARRRAGPLSRSLRTGPSGAALQLVDIMDGPSEVSGAPGAQDGRLDALLDIGTYKLRVTSAKGASGTVALAVAAFHDAAPPAALPPAGFPLAATLADGEQRAFWLAVPPDGPSASRRPGARWPICGCGGTARTSARSTRRQRSRSRPAAIP